jgi:hypothetical protein
MRTAAAAMRPPFFVAGCKLDGNRRRGAGISPPHREDLPMIDRPGARRRREPDNGTLGAVVFFGLIAAAGFAVGWVTQSLGGA